jgi:tetratricopeptide (TPR) repeat protein
LVQTAESGTFPDVLEYGARVLRRIAEDKIVNAHVFIPAAVALTLYLLDRSPSRNARPLLKRLTPWVAVVLALVTIVGTHPLGFGQYLVIVGSYLVIRWLVKPDLRALLAFLGIAVVVLAVALLPLAQLLGTRPDLNIFDWASTELKYGELIRVGRGDAYILHPGHVSAPIFLVGIALALLMAARLKQDRTARYLFATTAGPLFLTYTPYVASTLGNIIKPDMLERLLWLLPVGLSIAAACWLVVDWLRARFPVRLFPLLALAPLVGALALVMPGYQAVSSKVFDLSLRSAWPERSSPQLEDLAEALRPLVSLEKPVLAPAEVNTYLYEILSDVYVYHFRNGFVELRALYQSPWWGEDALALLEDFQPEFLVVENGSYQHTYARLQPTRYAVVYQNERYAVYRTAGAWPLTPTDWANTLVAQMTGTLVTQLLDEEPPEGATWPQAAALYELALAQNPEDVRAKYGLASVLVQMGDLDRAEGLYRELLTAFPEDGNVRVRLAGLLWEQGRHEEAIEALLALADPATLRAVLASPYLGALRDAQLAAVLDVWEAMPAFVSGPHPSRDLAAGLLASRGDRRNAIRVLEHIPPDYRTPEDLQLLGTLYLIGGDHERALRTFEADAGRSAVDQALYHLLRGHLAMESGDYGAARAAYQAAADAHPTSPAPWVFLGRAWEAQGDLGAAEEAYLRAASLELPPDFWMDFERFRAGEAGTEEEVREPEIPASIAQDLWGEVELFRFYTDQDRVGEADAAYRRAVTILDIAGIPAFPPEAPPAIVSPLALGEAGGQANIGIPGETTLVSSAVLNRSIAPPGSSALVTLHWLSYDLSSAAPWWEFKVVLPDTWEVLGDYSQATLTPEGSMARWTFQAPASLPDPPPSVLADVEVVAVVPEHEAGYFTYRVGQVMLAAPPPPDAEPDTRVDHRFGGQVELYGYTSSAESLRSGEALAISLFWRAVSPPPANLTAFVHLLDAEGNLVAQVDEAPASYPSSLWEADARVMGTHRLRLPIDLAPGQYRLVAGLYAQGTFERLMVDGSTDGTVSVGTLEVAER